MILAYRIAGDATEAEDIVQDAFTRAWVKAPAWQPREGGGASFPTWLARVVTNLSLDRLRRRRPGEALDAAEDVAADAPSPQDEAAGTQARGRIMAALGRLPERQRAAIALCQFEGLSNAEAARALEVSVGGLELLLVRARRSLRASLADLMGAGR